MATNSSQTVVFLGPAYPYRGGIASFTERLAHQYKLEGWKVKIFTYTFQYPKILFPGKNQLREDKPNYELDIERTVHSIRPSTWRATKNKILDLKPNLVIAPHWNPFMSYSLAAILKKLSIPKVVLVHNLYPHESGYFDTSLVNRIMKVDAKFLTISKSVLAQVQTNYPSVEVSQYPHPYYDHFGASVDKVIAADKVDLPPDRDYLLFFGLVRPYKGLSQLLSAFAKIANKYPNLDLLVAGEFYESVDIYNRIIENDKLESRVIIRDQFIPDRLVSAYFSIADLVMLPYISATQSGVGQIATHFDKPILVTDVGSLGQMTHQGKTGIVVESNSHSIATGIEAFFDQQLTDSLIQNIQQLKKEISWEGLYQHITTFVQ